MNYRNYLIFFLIAVLCISLAACGTQSNVDTETGKDTVSETLSSEESKENNETSADTDAETIPEEELRSVLIGDVDSGEYSIVADSDDTVAMLIADYFSYSVMTVTEKEMSIVESSDSQTNVILVGDTAKYPDLGVGDDEFIIKFTEGKLYIVYDEGASAFQAVSAVMDDVLFSDENAENNVYSLASDFELRGKCGDYVIGDNEFNPFE